MLREDVVDKVIKRDVLTLFNIRSPLLMEKLFLYLCMNSTEIFSVTTAAKELENTSASTIDSYIEALEMSNLIYLSKPMDVGSKGALKGKPKIYIADAAIRNAVLMIDDVLSDERELGAMVETTVYKHIVSFYQGSTAQLGYFRKAKDNQKEVDVVIELPREKILCEVKYRNNSHIPATDAIVELCKDESAKVTSAFLITKQLDDFGIAKHETHVPILRVPAIAFLYLLGKAEADGQNGKMKHLWHNARLSQQAGIFLSDLLVSGLALILLSGGYALMFYFPKSEKFRFWEIEGQLNRYRSFT